MDFSEGAVQHALHHMSHQKVQADEKWGALQLTPERVQRLMQVVESDREKYDHESVYLSILERWDQGDFSKAVHDHNAIWRLQNGNTGMATRLLNTEEEQEYIENNFQ